MFASIASSSCLFCPWLASLCAWLQVAADMRFLAEVREKVAHMQAEHENLLNEVGIQSFLCFLPLTSRRMSTC